MKKIFWIIWMILTAIIFSLTVTAQSDIRMTKKIRIKMPDVEKMNELPATAQQSLAENFNRTATVYLKGARRRTGMPYKTVGLRGMKTRTRTMIMQCDAERTITFDNQQWSATLILSLIDET